MGKSRLQVLNGPVTTRRIRSHKGRGAGVWAYRSIGVLECWSVGVLEWWSGGVLEWWGIGVVEYWSGGLGVIGGVAGVNVVRFVDDQGFDPGA
jgi:hypothetical protein